MCACVCVVQMTPTHTEKEREECRGVYLVHFKHKSSAHDDGNKIEWLCGAAIHCFQHARSRMPARAPAHTHAQTGQQRPTRYAWSFWVLLRVENPRQRSSTYPAWRGSALLGRVHGCLFVVRCLQLLPREVKFQLRCL